MRSLCLSMTCCAALACFATGCDRGPAPGAQALAAPPAGTFDFELKSIGKGSGKIGLAYAFVRPAGDAKQIELYLFDEASKAKACDDFIEQPQIFSGSLPDGTKTLIWHASGAGQGYRPSGGASAGWVDVFSPGKSDPKKPRYDDTGSWPAKVTITSIDAERVRGTVDDAGKHGSLRAEFDAVICK